ncbi:MAG: nucleoside deaminase [Bacillota bacterium]|nr:nucleoside deaminase [Bacillota bacterium]
MKEALIEAQKAYDKKEVPIGAVVVYGDEIVGRGHDTMETDKDPTCHAEISAIRNACRTLDRWRMIGCDLYVTTDPCQMCSGAIQLARFDNVYVGTRDGILAKECAEIIKDFFKALRQEDKENKKKQTEESEC